MDVAAAVRDVDASVLHGAQVLRRLSGFGPREVLIKLGPHDAVGWLDDVPVVDAPRGGDRRGRHPDGFPQRDELSLLTSRHGTVVR